MIKTENISLADLKVNSENYRFEPVESQREAINKMVENQDIKLYELAKHISENGLNPNDMIQVTPYKKESKKFVVLEGNRRVIALKLLSNPNLIDETSKKTLQSKFKELHEQFKDKLIANVECTVYSTPEEAEKWIKLKHTGSNNGVGVEPWTKIQTDRFNHGIGENPSLTLQVIKILKSAPEVPNELKAKLSDIKATNLERLIQDPDLRALLGIELNKGLIGSRVSKSEVTKGLTQLVEDILKPNFSVKDIYFKSDREDYISKFNPVARPNIKIKANKPWQVSGVLSGVNSKTYTQPAFRRRLIPKTWIVNINNPKINRIYRELQGMDVAKFTNAAAVLLRVFVELSCDAYMDAHHLKQTQNKGEYMKLKNKALAVVDDLIEKSLIKNPACKGIRTAVQHRDSLLGIDTLHAYIHNKNFSPMPKDLIVTWDNIDVFLEKVLTNTK